MQTTKVKHYFAENAMVAACGHRGIAPHPEDNYPATPKDQVTCPFCRDALKLEPRQVPLREAELISDDELVRMLNDKTDPPVLSHDAPAKDDTQFGMYVHLRFRRKANKTLFTGWRRVAGDWIRVNEIVP